MTRGSKYYNRKLTPSWKNDPPLAFYAFFLFVCIWVLMTLKVMFCLYLCNIALWYINNIIVICHNTFSSERFPFLTDTAQWAYFLHLYQHQYFVSNFKENIVLGPHSVNCLRQMKWVGGVGGGRSYFCGIIYSPVAHHSKCYKNVCQFILWWYCVWFIQTS